MHTLRFGLSVGFLYDVGHTPIDGRIALRPAIRLLVVDDHRFTALGVKRYADNCPDIEVLAVAADAREARSFLEKSAEDVDMVVMDLSLAREDGLEVIRSLIASWPDLRIVVHSMHEEAIYAEPALRAGAEGYVMKSEDPAVLVRAIRKIHQGQIHLSPDLQMQISARFLQRDLYPERSVIPSLSERELVVLKMLGQGRTSREVADSLHLSFKTVQTYRERLKTKLGLRNASELVHYAIRFVQSEARGEG